MTFASAPTVSRLLCCCFIAVLFFMLNVSCQVQASRTFKVGNEFGWKPPTANDTAFYGHWATSNRFHIGDSLLFEYQKDSVIEVDKWGFYHCNGNQSMIAFDNGNSTVKLDRPGPFYFISGVLEHCKTGQRLIVEVMHVHRHPVQTHSPPMVAAAAPDQYSTMAPSPLSATSLAPVVPVPFVSFLLGFGSVLVLLLWSQP